MILVLGGSRFQTHDPDEARALSEALTLLVSSRFGRFYAFASSAMTEILVCSLTRLFGSFSRPFKREDVGFDSTLPLLQQVLDRSKY